MTSWHYNPERRTWRGKSYRKGGENIRHLKEEDDLIVDEEEWFNILEILHTPLPENSPLIEIFRKNRNEKAERIDYIWGN